MLVNLFNIYFVDSLPHEVFDGRLSFRLRDDQIAVVQEAIAFFQTFSDVDVS